MRCIICGNNQLTLIKKIKNRKILECKKCELAITENNFFKTDYDKLYDFKEYKLSELKLKKRINRLLKIIRKFKCSGKVLDVGAGFGLFSSILMKDEKFKITVLEPYLDLKYLNKNKTSYYKLRLEEFLKINRDKYDLILLIDVLEHFKSPIVILKKLKKHLKKNGYIVVQIPNYRSLMASLCINWSWWMIEDHRFHFSPKSINLLLKKVGFKIDFLITYEDFIDFKKNFDGNFSYISYFPLRKFFKILFYPPFLIFYYLVKNIIWKLNFGGLIFLIARYEFEE